MVGCKEVKKRYLWKYFSDVCGKIKPTFVEIALGTKESRKEDASNKLVI